MFTKPHANTPAVRECVAAKFKEVGITVVTEGDMDGATIDSKKHIDQHYYAIASKATLLKPSELNVPKDKFKDKFNEECAPMRTPNHRQRPPTPDHQNAQSLAAGAQGTPQ